MGFGNCGGGSGAYNWEAANTLFERTPLPKTTRRGRSEWESNERPLDDARKHQYRIVKNGDGKSYDMVLYHTVMARYYRPTAKGRRVLYAADPRTLSSQFIWHVINARRLLEVTTSEGAHVASPLYDRRTIEDDDCTRFSADLFFNAEGRLVVAKSRHTPHYKEVSTPEDKARRVALKEKFANLTMLAIMRLPEFERCVEVDRRAGKPFRGAYVSYQALALVRELCHPQFDMKNMPPAGAESFFAVCQAVYDTLASKRAYVNPWRSRSMGVVQRDAPITSADFERSLWRKLRDIANVDDKSGKVPLPQFMDWGEYPRSNAHAY